MTTQAEYDLEIIKAKARGAVLRAIKSGRLVRPKTCSDCGVAPGVAADGRSRIQAHHETYDDPLIVVWLCYWCHQKAHGIVHQSARTGGEQWLTIFG